MQAFENASKEMQTLQEESNPIWATEVVAAVWNLTKLRTELKAYELMKGSSDKQITSAHELSRKNPISLSAFQKTFYRLPCDAFKKNIIRGLQVQYIQIHNKKQSNKNDMTKNAIVIYICFIFDSMNLYVVLYHFL